MQANTSKPTVSIFEPPTKPKITKEMIAAQKSLGISVSEQKAALQSQHEQMKAEYAQKMETWKKAPQITKEEEIAEKENLRKLSKNIEERKSKANITAKKQLMAAKQEYQKSDGGTDAKLAYELKKQTIKTINRNTILDQKEEYRVAEHASLLRTCSPDEIYKLKKRRATKAAIARDKWLYVMLFPFIMTFIVFSYLPMPGLQIAFKTYSISEGYWASPWAPQNGLKHFIDFFNLPNCWSLFRNTIYFNVLLIVFGFPVPIILALLLNEVRNKMFKTTIQTLSYLPHFVSIVVIAGLVTNFLSPSHGLINYIYKWLNNTDQTIYFLTKPEYFRTIFIIMDIWKGAGFASIIYVSALVGIDSELYEAARIDGAGRWRQLLSITLPGILPTISIMLIMRIGNILNLGYEAIILLYQPITYPVADVISTFVYRKGLAERNFEMATAVGLFNGIVALILVTAANTVSRKVNQIGLW